jgi:hypothetical protein
MAAQVSDLQGKLQAALAPLAVEAGYGMTDQPWTCGAVEPISLDRRTQAEPSSGNTVHLEHLAGAPSSRPFWTAADTARPFPQRQTTLCPRMAQLEGMRSSADGGYVPSTPAGT